MSPKKKSNVPEEVLDNISDAFVSVDPNFIVTYINKPAEDFSGEKRKDIIGKSILEAFPQTKNTVFSESFLQIVNEKNIAKREKIEFETLFDVPPLKKWYNFRVFPYKKGFNIFFQDITSKKNAELKLIESKEKYRSMLENIPDEDWTDETELEKAGNNSLENEHLWPNLISNLPGIVYRCKNDNNWTMTFVSRQCEEITGYAPSDLINNSKKAYNDLIFEKDRETVWNTVQNALKKNEAYETNYRILTRQNEMRWVWERGVGVEDENGELFLEGFIEDITDQRQAEDALKESEERNRTILKKLPATVWMTDKYLRFISSSGSGLALLGVEEDQVMGMSLNEFFKTDDPEHPAIAAHKQVLKGESVNYSMKHQNIIWETYLEPSINSNNEIIGVIGVAYNVTQQREAEKLLRISEEKYRHIFENAMEGIFQSTPEGKYISVNPAFARIGGFNSPEDMIDSVPNIKDLYVHPEDRDQLIEQLQNQEGVNNFEIEIKRKDGSLIWITTNVMAVRDKNGKLKYLQGSIIDISQRKHVEEILRREEEKLRLIIDSSQDFIYSYDMQGSSPVPIKVFLRK